MEVPLGFGIWAGTKATGSFPVIWEDCTADYSQSGKYRRTRLFVPTLGYSRKSAHLIVFRSSSQTWPELHEKAFRRLTVRVQRGQGGVTWPRRVGKLLCGLEIR